MLQSQDWLFYLLVRSSATFNPLGIQSNWHKATINKSTIASMQEIHEMHKLLEKPEAP